MRIEKYTFLAIIFKRLHLAFRFKVQKILYDLFDAQKSREKFAMQFPKYSSRFFLSYSRLVSIHRSTGFRFEL